MYFFLIATTPLSAILGLHYFNILPFSSYVISSAAIVVALQYYNNKKIWTGLGLFITLTILTLYLNEPRFDLSANIAVRCIIISYFFYFMMQYTYKKDVISYYFIVLIVYEISLILKMITLLTNIQTGLIYYNITSIFEFLICIFFIIYNIENSPRSYLKKI